MDFELTKKRISELGNRSELFDLKITENKNIRTKTEHKLKYWSDNMKNTNIYVIGKQKEREGIRKKSLKING